MMPSSTLTSPLDDTLSVSDDGNKSEKELKFEDPEDIELDFNDVQATSYLSMLSSLFIGSSNTKPSYAVGTDSWVPSDPELIVKVPENVILQYKTSYPLVGNDVRKNGVFSVYTRHVENSTVRANSPLSLIASAVAAETNVAIPSLSTESAKTEKEAPVVHHLIFTFWKGSKENRHILSLFRSEKVTDVIALCERCRECRDLFFRDPKGTEKRIYLSQLLMNLRSHILWKSVHIAALLGNIEYFQKRSRRIHPYLQCYCQPEGMTPLMIAIKHNFVPLTDYLIELGSDVTALTLHGHDNVLHLASVTSVEMVKVLMKSGKCGELVNQGNRLGCSPLYYAVTGANAYCAKELKNYGASLTANSRVDALKTPLIEAMKKPKSDVPTLKAIFEKYPDAHNHKDPLTGNSALHSAVFKKTLLSLLELKSCELNLNVRNLQMQTPLHTYVLKNDLQLVMVMVSFKIDIDAKDRDGNTALHLAVMNMSLEIVRALLVMGAAPNIANIHGETPRHIAAKFKNNDIAHDIVASLVVCGAKRCIEGAVGCTSACVHWENFVADPTPIADNHAAATLSSENLGISPNVESVPQYDPSANDPQSTATRVKNFPQQTAINGILIKLRHLAENKKENTNIISVLALDGGGIKGLVIVQVLIALQKYLDEPLMSYFDWVAGTSTGSFVSAAFFKDFPIADMPKLYLRFKDRVFDSTWSRPYNTAELLNFLVQCYGEGTTLADIEYPKFVFTTVRADTFPVQLELMRNYQFPLTKEENEALGYTDPKDLLLWKATRRSSAAPTYFPAAEGKFIDGGMVSNNPTLDLLSEIQTWNSTCEYVNHPQTVQIGCVVSVGTGISPVAAVEPSLYEMSDMFGLLRGMKNLTRVVLDQVTATEGPPVSRSRTWCHSMGTPFYRLNPPLYKDIPLDAVDDLELVRMMWDVVIYANKKKKEFLELANLLKSIGTNKNRKVSLARCTPRDHKSG